MNITASFIEFIRNETGSENHIFLNIDTICYQENLPLPDVICLTADKEITLTRKYISGVDSLKLTLPVALVAFLSYGELQMLIYWKYMQFGNTNVDRISILTNRYKYENALSIIIKTESIQELWGMFCQSYEGQQIKEQNSVNILAEFKSIIDSSFMWNTVDKKMCADKRIFRLIKELDEQSLSNFIDNAALIRSSEVFPLQCPDFK